MYFRPLVLISFFLLFVGCDQSALSPKIKIDEATIAMVDELRSIALDRKNIQIWHLNKERAQAIDAQIPTINDPGIKISMLFKAGIEWLNAGYYELSIERLNNIMAFIDQQKITIPGDALFKIKEVLGIAYLRKAEVENCIAHHNEYSCIMPIQEQGQHVNQEGATKASHIFYELLKEAPDNQQVLWLYNLSQMTLGNFPDSIDKDKLLDPSIFDSELPFPRFTDYAMALGVAVNDISGSVIMDDFNNDNYLDLMVSSYGRDDQLMYFQNDRKGSFENLTSSAGLEGLWSGLNMVQADYNNDGWLDLLILRGAWLGKDGKHPNSLLKNNGDGTFSDVTVAAGLYSHLPTQTASWADYNNDGWLDLFVGNEHSASIDAPCQLYENNKDGTFSEIAAIRNLNIKAYTKACSWTDYDNDGNMDIYISVINGKNKLFRNGGKENKFSFTDFSAAAKVEEPINSFPVWFFDYDQDGWQDLFVSGFDFSQFETAAGEVAKDYLGLPTVAEKPRLYHNEGDGTFVELSRQNGVDKVLFTMGCNTGDINNDGYPDFYAATGTPDFRALIPNRMFLNINGAHFSDVTTAGGFGHLQKGHGVAFGDIDMDGDQDMYNVLGGSYDGDNFMNTLYINPGNTNAWIHLKLIGTEANRSAIGARVKITASNKNNEKHVFFQRLSSGGSFGANSLLIEQGLGKYSIIEEVEIIWPGDTDPVRYSGFEANNFYIIEQNNKLPSKVDMLPLTHSKSQHQHHS